MNHITIINKALDRPMTELEAKIAERAYWAGRAEERIIRNLPRGMAEELANEPIKVEEG